MLILGLHKDILSKMMEREVIDEHPYYEYETKEEHHFSMLNEADKVWIRFSTDDGVFIDFEVSLVEWLQEVNNTLGGVISHVEENDPVLLLKSLMKKLKIMEERF